MSHNQSGKVLAHTQVDTQAEGAPSPSTYTLTIQRANQFFFINPPIKISVGKIDQMSVANGETVEISLPVDTYAIYLSFGILKRAIAVDLSQDATVAISVSRVTGGIRARLVK